MSNRVGTVYGDLISSRLSIEERPPLLPLDGGENKNTKIYLLRQQSENIQKKISEIN